MNTHVVLDKELYLNLNTKVCGITSFMQACIYFIVVYETVSYLGAPPLRLA